jgi:hypothetical protein
MINIKEGDVILLEHSTFRDRHQIGRAVKDATSSTVNVVYYHTRDGWLDEPHRRTTRHVVGIIKDQQVDAVSKRIETARLEMESLAAAARKTYNAVLAAETIK